MPSPEFTLQSGTIYVTEMVGLTLLDRPSAEIFKVGKTFHSVRDRIAPASTFSPNGIRVHRSQTFYDYSAAETRIHADLAPWHIKPGDWGTAKEMFSVGLAVINEVINDHLALQRARTRNAVRDINALVDSGFFTDDSSTLLDEFLKIPVLGKLTFRDAIVRSINSTSNEENLRMRLVDFGIEVNRRSKTANISCRKMLGGLCRRSANARSLKAALENVDHFNSHGLPVFV
jgi:hypothetical protein